MPSKKKPKNNHNFNHCVSHLSGIIAFEQPEKLSDFIRRTVQWLLEKVPPTATKSKKPVSENGLTFQIHPGSLVASEFELDFYRKADEQKGIPMVTVKCRGGHYRGLPDEHPKVEHIGDLPTLVARRLIYAKAFRKGSRSEWSKIRHNGNGDLSLDCEINGCEEEKE